MANDKMKSLDLEDKMQVVVTPEDVGECAKFFQFFDIPVSEDLKKAFETFQKDPSYAHQCEVKYELAKIIATSEHNVFKDEVFAQVRPETREVFEALDFERQFERTISSPDSIPTNDQE